ncbi:transmembrane protein 182 [Centropristis striata]|uniref:transmembrane protein 182 n=1 Tax=Centropristis striata TaxID=184440 RepID=UPI0027E17974|nr:transmembrane protein 182 [Centropristis striata]
MKLSVALFFAGLFGALAAVFILLSFGTDYWLLASESCPSSEGSVGPGGVTIEPGDVVLPKEDISLVTSYHEGFFWKCSFTSDSADENSVWKIWFTYPPYSKLCVHAYLFPFPISHQTHNATEYDSAIIYRGFWSIFMLIGVAAVLLGGFFIICAAPFASHRLYKAGGGLFLASGLFLLCVVVMYVLWLQVLDVVDVYIDHRRSTLCQDFQLSINYGLSFMFAPVGIFFCLLSGLLFLLIGRTIQVHYN